MTIENKQHIVFATEVLSLAIEKLQEIQVSDDKSRRRLAVALTSVETGLFCLADEVDHVNAQELRDVTAQALRERAAL